MASSPDDTILDLGRSSPESSSDQLHFQDIPHGLEKSPTPEEKVQTHKFTNFPVDDSDEDKEELLKEEKQPPSFWTFEYYQQYFDVDTYDVLHRSVGSMLPNPNKNFLKNYVRPNPDLYGPFWICSTLVFTTAIAGNMANYIQAAGINYNWQYDFHKVTFAAAAIYCYWWLIPTAIFGLLWWRNSQAGYTYLEIICVYGYSLAIYIPISILWVIPVNWLQWLLVMLGMVLSGSVLLLTFWPAVRDDEKKIAYLTMSLIFIFHSLLAIGFMLYFFHVPSIPASTVAPSTVHGNHTVLTTAKSI